MFRKEGGGGWERTKREEPVSAMRLDNVRGDTSKGKREEPELKRT